LPSVALSVQQVASPVQKGRIEIGIWPQNAQTAANVSLGALKRLPDRSSFGESGFVGAKGYQFNRSGRKIFVVKRSHCGSIFASGEQLKHVLQWLTSTNRLALAHSQKGRNIVKQQRQAAGRREKKVIHDRLKQFVYDETLTAN
jgi:hypothetical protein